MTLQLLTKPGQCKKMQLACFEPPSSTHLSFFCLDLLHKDTKAFKGAQVKMVHFACNDIRPDQMINPDLRSTSVRSAFSALIRSMSTCKPVYAATQLKQVQMLKKGLHISARTM